MKVIYHIDLDGKCAGAIAGNGLSSDSFIPMNYNLQFPLERIAVGEPVTIVDFSFDDVKQMHALLDRTLNVTWIDHHRTALERYSQDERIRLLPGIRDTREAGCVLAWEFFRPQEPVAEAVKLIGDRDIWRWAFGERTKYFHAGMLAEATEPYQPIWRQLFDPLDDRVAEIVSQGAAIQKYREQAANEFREQWAFPAAIEGIACLCLNATGGSAAFGAQKADFPILLTFVYDGRKMVVSLYSTSKGGVDVGRIAEKFGGGGHPGAAGFEVSPDTFLNIIGR